MEEQITNRLGVAHVRDTVKQFVAGRRSGTRTPLRRAIPQDGWWELVWSEWSRTVVGRRGRVYLADGRFCPTECANGTKVWLCWHIDDTVSVVLNKPEHGVRPTILFRNNPRVRKT